MCSALTSAKIEILNVILIFNTLAHSEFLPVKKGVFNFLNQGKPTICLFLSSTLFLEADTKTLTRNIKLKQNKSSLKLYTFYKTVLKKLN